ncbi:MAG TPA: maleylpyruvate isomerase family mycothiol-dependent enzyme [Micromonosporaceae bacterium]|jgi:uncharacterized protein (TIGR03083 family)
MPTHLSLDDHLTALRRSGDLLRDAAASAGLDATVPTCPAWNVADLVTHQGMVHRWAAANLRGDRDSDTDAFVAEAAAASDLLAWFDEGLQAVLDTLASAPEDVAALVFLRDAPPPRRFWARRQAHETTIHGVDAVAASLGRWPTADRIGIEPALAADGIDELLTGFITRGKGKLHTEQPCTLVVRAEDTGHAWTVQLSDAPIVTTVGLTEPADAVFTGSAAQLYLSLWNRADELTVVGDAGLAKLWRDNVHVRWS